MYDISVIVPVYNAERYLRQCIDSILNQTKKNIELVLVNDGSTDHTPDLIDEYASKYANVAAIHQTNMGVEAARSNGYKAATGMYIGWVDADDFVQPDMYEKLFNLAMREKADYVYCNYDFYPDKVSTKDKWFKKYKGVRDADFIDRNTQCWNTLVLKKLYDDIKIDELLLKYSEYCWIVAMLKAKKIAFTEESLYCYRVGHDSLSGGNFRGRIRHYKKGARLSYGLKELIQGTGYEVKLADYMDYRYIYTLIQLQIVAGINRDKAVYANASSELKRLRFKKNPYTKAILDENHGKLRSFVLRNIIPSSYLIAAAVTGIVFK